MNELSVGQVQNMILYVADEMIASKDELTRIDAQIGDGDHGIGMENGFRNVKKIIGDKEFDTINSLYRETGMAMINSMGGASGVLFGSLFFQGVKGMQDFCSMDSKMLVKVWSNGLNEVKRRGGAQVGDKTMVDALEPAVKAMQNREDEKNLMVIVEKAVKAAKEGMENTKQMTAKYGRAKSLMERAVGYQDAGATSIYFILRAEHQYLKMLEKNQKEIL